MNKKGSALGFCIFFILIFFISSYFADTTLYCEVNDSCSDTTLFRMSSETNAHAELSNNSNWLSGWDNRINFTIDNIKVNSNLTWFPATVFLNSTRGEEVFTELDADADYMKVAFTKADGTTELYAEKELFNDSEQKAIYHVSRDGWIISNISDTVFYMYYDNEHANNTNYVGDTGSRTEVWDSNFMAVYHMNDGADTSHVYDSTSNNNDGDKKAANEPIVNTSGRVGNAQDFDGNNDLVNLPDNNSFFPTDAISVEAWIKRKGDMPAVDGYGGIVEAVPSWNNGYMLIVEHDEEIPVNAIDWRIGNGTTFFTVWGPSATLNQWIHVAGTYDSVTGKIIIYIDGENYTSKEARAGTKIAYSSTPDIAIDLQPYFIGLMDEIRISNTTRAPAWINATYYSTKDDLLTYGSEETLYEYEICCNNTAGLNIGTSCSGEYETLLHFSDQTNAHAELNNESNYNDFSVCISSTDGLLNCSYESNCNNSDTCLASVSGSTNAHVGNCTDYTTKICCNITTIIVNTAPTIIANATIPENVYTNTDWMLNLTVTDSNVGDTITVYTQFYVNGTSSGSVSSLVVTNGTNTNVANLSSSSFNKGANLTAEFWAGDATANTTKYNTTQVTVLNGFPSQVTLSYPENNDSFFTNRTPRFNWTAATDIDNEQLTYQILVSLNSDVSSPLTNETGISNTYYTQSSELDFATYYWKVRANDSNDAGDWSDIWNFTLVPSVSIILVNDSINFGTMAQFEVNDTADDKPEPFRLENDGNIEANISVNSTSLWQSSSAQLNTSYYQFKADNSTEVNSFNWLSSQNSWSDMSDIYKSIIAILNHTDSNDLAEIDIRVEVASDEPPGSKSASLTFYAEES